MKPFITLTGADERTDVSELVKLSEAGAEIGLLYSANPEGKNRYPSWSWIVDAAGSLPRASLHICGKVARQQLARGELYTGYFQRIQINGGVLCGEIEYLCAMYPKKTIITQHQTYLAHLLCVNSPNHAILVDASGGRGLLPMAWGRPETDKHVGFAGGLGPQNLDTQLPRIRAVAKPGWWVDLETWLRVDDWFSIERAKACQEIFNKEINS